MNGRKFLLGKRYSLSAVVSLANVFFVCLVLYIKEIHAKGMETRHSLYCFQLFIRETFFSVSVPQTSPLLFSTKNYTAKKEGKDKTAHVTICLPLRACLCVHVCVCV